MTEEEFRTLRRGNVILREGRRWIVTDTDTVRGVAPGTVVLIPEEEVTLSASEAAECTLLPQ